MKKILMASAALLTMVTASSAADLYAKAPAHAAPVFNWTGFYVGVNAGYGGGESAIITESPLGSGVLALKSNGFLGGGQFGYNWQAGQFLYGFEADIQGTGVKSSLGLGGVVGGDAGTTVDYFGTVRGRIGFLPWERLVVYATGGLAYGQTTTDSGVPLGRNTKLGWTAGAGFEYMIAPNWSLKTEYLYVDLGKDAFNLDQFGLPPGTGFSISEKTDMHVVRAGVNYHF